MEWFRRNVSKVEHSQENNYRRKSLEEEIWEAHKDLRVAELKLNEAVDPDQIDYAIYITEAAEQRLNMLIREARQQKLDLSVVEVKLHELKKNNLNM